uniref:Copia protein n=1 Tax=Tanacetum cinerariifolium TaxID=118510 RepID=A0A6L2MEW8_TANCI|nr:copia protein [Tanacetum cinerariifolium]
MTDYSLWEVILNGDSPIPTKVIDGVVQPVAPTTAEQRLARKNELKARGTLLMALLDKHKLKFNIHKDAKSLMEAIEKWFGGNKETKKVQKTLLKQQYEIFTGSINDVTSVSGASTKVPVFALPNVDTLSDAVIYSFFASQSNSLHLDNDDLKQIDAGDLEEMDLTWQLAMPTMRARRFLQRTRRNVGANGTTFIGFDMSKADEEPTNYALMAFTSSSSSSSDNKVASCSKACAKAYATLQSHYDKLTNDLRKSQFDVLSYKTGLESGTFMSLKPDLVFHDAPTVNETVPTVFNVKLSVTKPNKDLSQSNRPSAPIIKDWNSDLEDEFKAENLKKDIPTSRGYRYSWNRMACFLCKSLTHLIKNCDCYEKKMVHKPIKNYAMRGKIYHYARMTHPHPHRHVLPTSVLTRSRLVPLTAARPVTTDVPQTKVQHQRPSKHGVTKAHSPIRRPINLKPSPHLVIFIKKLLLLRLTRLMLLKVSMETGIFAFGGILKGGKITGKGKIRIGKLDFNDVYFVKELKFNLFSVSQMCDKKNNVLFTDTECIVMSSNFKLLDDNHVLLRVPRENNMYNVDLKNIVHSGNLTCIFGKDTLDESNLWHRRVLVTKPHNKTPYELLLGRTPSIGFMRPFGCPVTIVNTLDPLGKFNGKADEGVLVEYSVSSKAFRVFNCRTRIVQETLLINFLENQPNVAGSGPTWLFDIDTLTQSMNYQPVVAGNQPNSIAGIQEHFNASKAGEGNVQQYVLFPLWSIGSKDPQNTDADTTFEIKEHESAVHVFPSSSAKTKKHDDKTKREAKGKSPVELSTGVRKLSEEFEAFSFNSTNGVNAASTPVTDVEPNSTNSANTFSAAGPFNSVEEGIDYEEVFALVVRIEAIRLFLAYASFMGFMVYQMDVKSAFLYGTIEEEVYVCQPSGFEDHDYPDKVYKVVKALYGLHQAPRAWYETLANYLLENGYQRGKIDQTLFIKKQKDGKSASTLIDTEKPLLKAPDVKRIFRYHKGKPHLGLWYPKDSPFNLVVYFESDYASASLDRKSTTGGCQFLGCRLISWQCKKQTVVATLSTEAEYVAAASCCAQVL